MALSTLKGAFLLVSVFFLLVIHSSRDVVASDFIREAHALLKFYPRTPTSFNHCTWIGIDCNPVGSIIGINLRGFGLNGTLHEFSFPSFAHLAYLDLGENQLFDTIPPEIGQLSKLIHIEHNELTYYAAHSMRYEDIIQATNNFDAKCCIGAGGSGMVYKAEVGGDIFAVKKFDPLHDGMMDTQEAFMRELRVLTGIRHRNIVRLYAVCSSKQHLFLVNEYVKKGSLAKILSNDDTVKDLDWIKRINIIKDLANALSYIHHDHRHPIVHKDITSNNILLNSEYVAQVTDFGAAKLLMLGEQHSGIPPTNWTSPVGSLGYAAPAELDRSGKVTEKCDVYGFGVIILEVLKGKHPGNFMLPLSSLSAYIGLGDLLDERLSPPTPEVEKKLFGLMKLAFCCLYDDPHSRPNMRIVSRLLTVPLLS